MFANFTPGEVDRRRKNQRKFPKTSRNSAKGDLFGGRISVTTKNHRPKEIASVKITRKSTQRKTRTLPELRFDDQQLTSFGGLVVLQLLFDKLQLRDRLRQCFRHLQLSTSYDYAVLMLGLIVHLFLGYRTLQDIRFYRDDPMVLRLLGLRRLPDVSTLSRMLKNVDLHLITRLRELLRSLVLQRLVWLQPPRLTLDFDGSVQTTGRKAEGSAIGFNKKKKGQRSYYPLFCTISQTGQVFDFLHRSGNVHDSNGAREFVLECIGSVRALLPGVLIEIRMDSAFFSDEIVRALDEHGVEFTISVPFARFVELKQKVEERRRWRRCGRDQSYFELRWKPKSWPKRFRFLVLRKRFKRAPKGPVQLDLFEPYVEDHQIQVVVTNKTLKARSVSAFHNGRGAQEGIFAELKSQGQMDYVPVKTRAGNQAYLLAAIFAHNLNRELQMQISPPQRRTTAKRAPLWVFEQLDTLRRQIFQRAGRLIRPQGILTLVLGTNEAVEAKIRGYLEGLQAT